jgi:hypothetical protein
MKHYGLPLLAWIACVAWAWAEPPKPESHTKRAIEGWTVHVDDRLLAEPQKRLGDRALRLLSHRLCAVTLALPDDKRTRLQQVPIWLDLTHGALGSPQYHPSADWLKDHGYSQSLARCIHIPDAEYFAAEQFQREQPWGVMHELAHAYHDQVLGFEHESIHAAWQKFRMQPRYQSVLHMNGKLRPHYALTDPKEFFAEMTEAYFGMNDFFPFNAAELQREDAETFALLAEIWGPSP